MKVRIYILLIVFGLVACEEIYVPEIPEQPNSLVIEGLITDQEGGHFVNISRSVRYNDTSLFEKVSGCTVFIQDKGGGLYLLREQDDGNYITDKDVKGIVGHEYRVIVNLPDGNSYISSFEPILPVPPIDSVTGAYHEKTQLVYREITGYSELTYTGIQVANSTLSAGFTPYYRYEYELVCQTAQIYPGYPLDILYYIARPVNSYSSSLIAITDGNSYADKYVVNNPVSFVTTYMMEVKVDVDSMEYDEDGNRILSLEYIQTVPLGIIVRLNQYSLNEDCYRFWEAVNNQMNATGQIFDPIESQIMGNIINRNDTTELVFGYFAASAVSKKSMFFYLEKGNQVITRPVKFFPELDSTIISNDLFDFWIIP